MTSTAITLDIWIDLVCPFCYLAKKRLTASLEQFQDASTIKIRWHSFQLDPNSPVGESLSSFDHLHIKKGFSIEQIEQMCIPLAEQGKEYGINFDFKKSLNFNTNHAHQLIHWAAAFGKGERLMHAFFDAVFCTGLDLSKISNVLSVCESVELDARIAQEVIQKNQFVLAVEKDVQLAQTIGLRGVPSFVHQQQLVLYGAPQIEEFNQLIQRLLSLETAQQQINSSYCPIR